MFSRIISHLIGRRPSPRTTTPRRPRPSQHLAAATTQTIDALESRVLLSTLYVDASAPGPTYNGSSWTRAYKDLQLALGAANAGDEIRIANGTYKPTSTTDRTISFALRDGVAIRGGYAGYGAADPDARDIALYPTILSGNIGAAGSSADNSYHVATATGVGASTALDGVTVTGGNANGPSAAKHSYGGGLLVVGASPTLINCTFSGSSGSGFGGGISNFSSSPTLTNCTFSGNSANSGGGMHNSSSSSPTLTNCTFSGNSASGSGYGGAMYNIASAPVLTNCTFSSNTAASSGGGMSNSSSSSPTLTNCTFSGNSASGLGGGMYNTSSSPMLSGCIFSTNSADSGAGMYNSSASSPALSNSTFKSNSAKHTGGGMNNAASSSPTLTDCTFSGNFASDSGGGMHNSSSSPTLTNCSFSANSVSSVSWITSGGAISNDSSSPTLINCTFSGNSASGFGGWGGGIYNSSSSPILTNCTFSSNSASRHGGGIYNRSSSSPILTNCTFNGNTASSTNGWGGGMYNESSSPTLANCLFSKNSATGSNGHGGGMYNSSSSSMLTNCTFNGNTASSDGGGICNSSSSPTLIGCAFSGNSAGEGGGIHNFSSSPALTNCIFSGNSAWSYGGGVNNDSSSSPTITNCTLSGNAANWAGSGVYSSSSSPTLINCIVWGNVKSAVASDSASTPTITYSAIQGGYAGAGNSSADPLFVRSPWTGPDGVFGTADDDFGELRLREGSPALDVGVNSAVSGVSTDLAGNVRIQGGTVDFGAYEGVFAAPAPKVLYVDTTARGAYTGTSWANAFTSLAATLVTATDGDIIRVAHGSYRPTSSSNRSISFALRNGVAIYGGYAGHAASDPDARDTALYPTILSGNIGAAASSTDNSYHVLTASAVGASTILDGVTVTGGHADGVKPFQSDGGGLYAISASLTLNNCTFSGNSASQSGGGMYNDSSSPLLADCTFSGNSASSGGGMYNSSSSPTVVNCSFSGNSASDRGGAMCDISSSPTLTNCLFSGNGVHSSTAGYGGAMYSISSSLTLTNCTISGNSASGNSTGYGGAIYYSSSSHLWANCIIWGNIASNGPQVSWSDGTVTITHSNIQGAYSGIGNINVDPLFVRLPWAGLDGRFNTADDDPGDLRLRPGSPMLNIGSNTAIPAGVSTDLAGNARIHNGTVDLGAYEGTTAPPTPRTFYVDLGAPTGANTGASWADAFTSLQSALAAAGAGGIIRVAGGTYRPTSGTDRTLSFPLRNDVVICGGYAGYGAPNPDARQIALYPTILSGDIGVLGSSADNSHHVVTAIGVGSSTALDGVTVTGGNSNGSGGGLLAICGSPTITNCTFTANVARTYGGAIHNQYSSSPKLTNCTFSGNSSGSYGGVMSNEYSSSPTLANCTFSGNSAEFGGGGMYNHSSSPTLTNCILWGNGGGALYDTGSIATITVTYSIVQGGYTGVGNVDVDPLFVRSPWNGPDGVFGTADDDHGDLRLRLESPASNGGSNTAVFGVSTDLAGNPRIQNDTVDLGAYEGATPAPAPKLLYVDGTATGTNTGVSWADAFASLQWALLAASDGDTIRIAGGTYRPTDGADRSISFVLRNGVAIYGGYAGGKAPNPDARDVALYLVIISGDIGTAGVHTDNSYHVVTASGVGPLTVLDGVTVTGGNANGSGMNRYNGGGLFATGASLTLTNCTFSGNSANTRGGGTYFSNCFSPTLVNCIFSGNSALVAYGAGAGMYNDSSSPTMTNCTFSGNVARGLHGSGGAIYSASISLPTLTNCILWGNTAANDPQIYRSGGTANVTFSNIQNGYVGTGNINADPLFVRNPSPGPDGLWNDIDDDFGDLRLQPTSPCIDRGNNAATGLSGIATDLAGRLRFVDIALTPDAGNGTPPIVDMGAYEAQWRAPAWLDPAGLAAWNASSYSLNIGDTPLMVAADDSNRSDRLTAIRHAITLGRNTGAGIVSTPATEDQAIITALDPAGNILIRLVRIGDVTLDDQLDGDDYFALDQAFLAGGDRFQPAADVNVDGTIDARDYFLLDTAFLRSAPATPQSPPTAPFSTRPIAEELLIDDEPVLA